MASSLSAEPAKAAKETSTKQSSVAELKPDQAIAHAATNAADNPVICVKPDAAEAQPTKTDTSSVAVVPASDAGSSTEAQSSSDLMRDKLKLSLGGKSGSVSDQPLQCGVDEAKEKEKDSDQSASK